MALAFNHAVDVANRALQHCGAERIDVTQGFSENSKRASETQFAYEKLRQAELERNVWTFATERVILRAIDTDTRLLLPALWSSVTTYFVGSIVSDFTGAYWISVEHSNLNQAPNASAAWRLYFGPLTVSLYDSGTSYSRGELVYKTTGNGTYDVYWSRTDNNEADPATADAWASTTTYRKNDIVTVSATRYMSLFDLNINNNPASSPAAWAVGTTYGAAATVAGSDGIIYTSIAGGNLGHDPVEDVGHTYWTTAGAFVPWTTSFTGGGNASWLQIGGANFPMGAAMGTLGIINPLTTGPSAGLGAGPPLSGRYAFRLPAGYLREAPQDPKAGSNSYLGAPSGLNYNDWTKDGKYILSGDSAPLSLRFVTDYTSVRGMSAMFCEMLACRIALEVCEPLTQSTSKLATIAKLYEEFRHQAIVQTAIEQGPVEPAIDDWIACRV